MPNESRPTIEELLHTYHSAAAIPEAILTQYAYVRVHRKAFNDVTIVDAEWQKNATRLARVMLKKRAGYFFTDDLHRLLDTTKGEDVLLARDFARIKRRAVAFQEAGIPPIFDSRYQIGFPTVDFIIQYVITTTSACHDPRHMMPRRVAMATVDQVRTFRTLAFNAEGAIEQALVREIVSYTRGSFVFQNDETRAFVLEHLEEALTFLGPTLRAMPPEPRTYLAVELDHAETFIDRRLWYLSVPDDQRQVLVQAFLDGLKTTVTSKQLRILRERVVLPFPEWAEGATAEARASLRDQERAARYDELVSDAVKTRAFGAVPLPCFEREPWQAILEPVLLEQARALIAQADQHLAVLRRLATASHPSMNCLLGLPAATPTPASCMSLLHAYRRQRIEALSDGDFRICFSLEVRSKVSGNLAATKTHGHKKEHAYWQMVTERIEHLDKLDR